MPGFVLILHLVGINLRITASLKQGLTRGVAVAFFLLTAAVALPQSVFSPPSAGYTGHAPQFRAGMSNQLFAALSEEATRTPLWEWGPFALRPHLLYRFLYGDGIPTAPGTNLTTAINQFYPGFILQLGEHWKLDYTSILHFYSSSHFRDTTDNSVLFEGTTTNSSLVLGLSQRYMSSSTPLIETSQQTDRESYSTVLSAAYQLNRAMSLELAADQDFRSFGQATTNLTLTDMRQWSTLDWLNAQFVPQFGAALGAGFGYVDVSAGSDMMYEQLQGRLNWKLGEKLALLVSGGFEDRQFMNSHSSDLVNPLFSATLRYHLFESTVISADASRTVNASMFAGMVTELTEVGGKLDQRLLHSLHLEVEGGYRTTRYETSLAGHTKTREDDRTHLAVRLRAPLFKTGTAALIYETGDNASSLSKFTLSGTQVGFELGYHF
jgi:hypothetical protein